MNTLRKRFAAPVAIALALLITPALSGCFSNPIEGIIEGVTGGGIFAHAVVHDAPDVAKKYGIACQQVAGGCDDRCRHGTFA